MILRWGIASAGAISHDFAVALATLPSSEHQIIAVAARELDRAKTFAELHKIPKAYGSYEELAKDPNVGRLFLCKFYSFLIISFFLQFKDVIYVGVIHPLHYDVSILMLNHEKHVLCEKPLCLNEKQVRKLINYAKEKKRFLMEAVWSRFLPSYQYLKEQIQNNVLGEIEEVDVQFGFDLLKVDRIM